ncbi:MAG: GIY-YIG nuclease family protein [Pseudomonadota bacterium]
MGKAEEAPKRGQRGAWIYALCDGRTGAVRYIGKADNPRKRLRQHLRAEMRLSFPVVQWIRKQKALGISPIMIALEFTEDWQVAEIDWIAHMRAIGAPLLNVAEGGIPLALKPYAAVAQRDPWAIKFRTGMCRAGQTAKRLAPDRGKKLRYLMDRLRQMRVVVQEDYGTEVRRLFDQDVYECLYLGQRNTLYRIAAGIE